MILMMIMVMMMIKKHVTVSKPKPISYSHVLISGIKGFVDCQHIEL